MKLLSFTVNDSNGLYRDLPLDKKKIKPIQLMNRLPQLG